MNHHRTYRVKISGIALLVFLAALIFPSAAFAQQSSADSAADTVDITDFAVAPELFERANDAFDAQNYRRAELDYSLFILLNPTFSPAYYFRAQALIQEQEYDRALRDLDRAIATSETFSETYIAEVLTSRGDLYTGTDQLDKAFDDYSQAISLAATVNALIGRGYIYMQRGDFALARGDFDEALAKGEDNAAIYIYRALATTLMNEPQAAAEDYLEFLNKIQTNAPDDDALVSGELVSVDMSFGVVHRMNFEARAGQHLDAVATGRTSAVDPLMVIIDSSGMALVADDDSGGNSAALIQQFDIPADDTYTLVVGHSLGGFDGEIVVGIRLTGEGS